MAGNVHIPDAWPVAFLEKNQRDPDWLGGLAVALSRYAERWAIDIAPPFPGIAWNYVAPAVRADGTRAVFKLSRHVGETRNEIAALRLWDGDGAARLLEADEDAGALLIERLEPGTMLTTVAETDDDAATRITAALLRRLWARPLTDAHGLRPLASWCAAYDRNREALLAGDRGFPADLFRQADTLRAKLLATTEAPVTLHGDMHHFNVLRADRAAWLAIDPKGLYGDRCFDICQFLPNPHIVIQGGQYVPPPELTRRRLAIFTEALALDSRRVRAWCFVHAMLNACWEYEDGGDWRAAVAYAEATRGF